MYKRKRLGPLRTVAIWNSEVGRYSGGVNVQYERQKKSVPEVYSVRYMEWIRYLGGSLSEVPLYMYSRQKTLNAHNSPLEGAMQLKQAPLNIFFRFL